MVRDDIVLMSVVVGRGFGWRVSMRRRMTVRRLPAEGVKRIPGEDGEEGEESEGRGGGVVLMSDRKEGTNHTMYN